MIPTNRNRLGMVTALASLVLGACGQSGPLYLPGNPSEVRSETVEPEGATDEIVEEGQGEDDRAEDDENEARE